MKLKLHLWVQGETYKVPWRMVEFTEQDLLKWAQNEYPDNNPMIGPVVDVDIESIIP